LGLIASMYMGNVIAMVLVLATVPLFAAFLRVPFKIIGPIIAVVCLTGAFTVASKEFDIWLALAFGAAGYIFKKLDYPLAPFVLAMVLGDKAEDTFRQAMLDRKSTRLNSSHVKISYAVFCLKKKTQPLVSENTYR